MEAIGTAGQIADAVRRNGVTSKVFHCNIAVSADNHRLTCTFSAMSNNKTYRITNIKKQDG
jgi:hypothetical protein